MSLKGTKDSSAKIKVFSPNQPIDSCNSDAHQPFQSLGSSKGPEFEKLINPETQNHKANTLAPKSTPYSISNITNMSKLKTDELEIDQNFQKPQPNLTELENFLQVRIRTDVEKVDEFQDEYPALEFRKAILRIKHSISDFFQAIVSSGLFQLLVITVIFINTVVLALEDPTWTTSLYPYNAFELFFAIFYTVEFGMIVIANGLFMNSNSYFRESWNFLDFTIIVTAWLSLYAQSGFSLSSLRAVRILRPLRSISSIKGMKVLMLALFHSIKPLFFSFFILFLFIYIFAIAAVQLWSGELRGMCMILETGINAYPNGNNGYTCGDYVCNEGQVCAIGLDNPYHGITNFDNIFISLITTFQIITLEGWTQVMEFTVTAFSYYSIFYYMPLVFIASDLILNFVMAIVIISFDKASQAIFERKQMNDTSELINEVLLQKIYRNTLLRNEKEFGKFALDGTEKCIEEEEKVEMEKGMEVVDVDVPEIRKNIKFEKGILRNAKQGLIIGEGYELGNESSEIFDGSEVKFESSFAIDLNSAFSRVGTVSARPVFNKRTSGSGISNKIEAKLSSQNFYSILPRVDYNQLTDIQPEQDTLKTSQNYAKLKSVVTIKNKTLNFLQKNPKSLNNTRIELVENFITTSDSCIEVTPVPEKHFLMCCDFAYYPEDTKNPLIVAQYSKINKIFDKYPEFQSKYKLFRFLSLKFSVREAFFMLEPHTKSLISEQIQDLNRLQGQWSGIDIFPSGNESNSIYIRSLSTLNYNVWHSGLLGDWQRAIFPLKCIITHRYIGYIMLLAVIINTIVLSLERYGISKTEEDSLQSINIFFTYFFTCELFLKIISLGPVQFIRDAMNIMDSIVVLLSLVELFILSGGTSLTAFRAIRVFRVFRVLRILKIFRYLKSMTLIVNSIMKSLSSIFYLFLLIILFLIIFTLLNMQVFGGNFNFPEGLPRTNFDTFNWAFITTFQLLTTENWNDILTSSLRSQNVGPCSCILLVVWIILGNYIFLNLFLAIMLDSFGECDDDPVVRSTHKLNSKVKKKIEDLEKYIDNESEEADLSDLKIKMTQLDYQLCEKSYFLFSKTNFLRVYCFKLTKNPNFDNIFLLFIIMNSIKLVWDTYILDEAITSTKYQISNNFDTAFTVCYMIEFTIKSIAIGFCIDSDSYLRDNWNKLDFSILVISIIDLSISSINIPVIKLFRVLRTIRPLKLIKHNSSMKISVNALMESFVGIVNVMCVILIIKLMYAILGVSLLAGKMHSCTNQLIMDIDTCHAFGYEWKEERFNFDNVFQGMTELFILMSQESWPNRMTEAVDATAVGRGPILNYDLNIAYFYIAYMVIANFYLLNLFTCVIFDKFTEAKNNESTLSTFLLSKEQVLWSEIQVMILRAKPRSSKKQFDSEFRKKCYNLSKSRFFEITMMTVILINMLSMSMNYYGASDSYNKALESINLACTFAFIAEAIIKITGLVFQYFKSHWNKFDFAVVIFCSLDIVLSYASISNYAFLRQGPQLARVLRVIRVVRLFKLIKSFDSLIKIMTIITYAMPAIINVLGLLLLLFFIYAVLGAFLFHSINTGDDVDYYFNFHNFHAGMILLWRMSTGEDYPVLMHDFASQAGSYGYYLYFISFVVLSDFVILDLFISIVLQYFEEFYVNPYNAFSLFSDDFKMFKRHWIKATKDFTFKVNKEGLLKFVASAGIEFKFLKTNDKLATSKLIGVMNIESDAAGHYYFNDVLYAMLRRKYYKKINKRQFRVDFTIMRVEDLKTRKELKKIRDAYEKMSAQQKLHSRGISERFPVKSQGLERNMFFEVLFLKSVFNNWKHYAANAGEFNQQVTPEDSDVEHPGDISLDGDYLVVD